MHAAATPIKVMQNVQHKRIILLVVSISSVFLGLRVPGDRLTAHRTETYPVFDLRDVRDDLPFSDPSDPNERDACVRNHVANTSKASKLPQRPGHT